MLMQNDHRRVVGPMEQIDYHPQEVESLRKQIDVAVPLELHWQWDYLGEIEELRSLYEKGKVGQWNAETDLDWRTPVPADEFSINPEESLMANVLGMVGQDKK